jgi:hypothetical protein
VEVQNYFLAPGRVWTSCPTGQKMKGVGVKKDDEKRPRFYHGFAITRRGEIWEMDCSIHETRELLLTSKTSIHLSNGMAKMSKLF